MGSEKKKKRIRWQVLLPPWIVVIAVLVLNLTNYEVFVASMNRLISWILSNFAWMFNSISLVSLILVIVVYLSPVVGSERRRRRERAMIKLFVSVSDYRRYGDKSH